MTIPVQQFAQNLMTSGLMTPDEAKSLWEQHSSNVPFTLESFATALRESGRLTTFQVHSLQAERCPLLALGSYELLDSLGHGGMGHVFRANHRDMDRTVALKILPPAVTSDRGAVDRFKREVKAAARLHHPRIVVAHDAGEFQGTHYLVMEHIDGPDLHALVRQRGQLSLAEATQFVTQAAEGLEYAHAQGVIHRDIKPSNLLAGPDGVKIMDLGLALLYHADHVTEQGETASGPLTETGTVMGTADFLPPEQAADTHSVDHRADIYSLGATLYFLLVGNPMYPEKTLVRKIFAHKDNPIPTFHEHRPDVPRELQQLFERMVAKRPEDRPQSMTEVLHELHALSGNAVKHFRRRCSGCVV
jgi:serine/threonine protein kinase